MFGLAIAVCTTYLTGLCKWQSSSMAMQIEYIPILLSDASFSYALFASIKCLLVFM